MGEMRLYAIGIDEVREIFAARPEVAERLRTAAAPLFQAAPKKKFGLLEKLGPMFKKPLLPPPASIDPDPSDADTILAGRFVPPERIPAAWQLVRHWLDDLGWGTFELNLTDVELDEWDFDLARAGMSSQYGIGRLLNEELGLPLRPVSGLATGYVKNAHALNMISALELSQEQLSGRSAEWTEQLLTWLRGFPHWTEVAPTVGRPVPDLVGLLSR